MLVLSLLLPAPERIVPGRGLRIITGYEPTLIITGTGGGYGGLLSALNLTSGVPGNPTPTRGQVAITGYSPVLTFTSGSSGTGLLAGLGSLTQNPGLSGRYLPQSASLSIEGYQPTLSRSVEDIGWDEFIARPATLAGTGGKNGIYDPRRALPLAGSVSLSGYAPTLLRGSYRDPLSGSIGFNGQQVTLTRQFVVYPASGSLALTGVNQLGYGRLKYGKDKYGTPRYAVVSANTGPQTGFLSIIGQRVTLQRTFISYPLTGAITATGYAPQTNGSIAPNTGAVAFTGYQPVTLTSSLSLYPVDGSVTISGYEPTLRYNYAATGVWVGGRAFIEVYEDVRVTVTLTAGNAVIDSSVGQAATGDGVLVAGNATISFRKWTKRPKKPRGWTTQSNATGEWTELPPNTDTWNG